MSAYTVHFLHAHSNFDFVFTMVTFESNFTIAPFWGSPQFQIRFLFLTQFYMFSGPQTELYESSRSQLASLHSPQPVAPSSTSHGLPWPYRDVNSTTPMPCTTNDPSFWSTSNTSPHHPYRNLSPDPSSLKAPTILTIQCPPPCPTTTFTLPGAPLWWPNSPDSTLRI